MHWKIFYFKGNNRTTSQQRLVNNSFRIRELYQIKVYQRLWSEFSLKKDFFTVVDFECALCSIDDLSWKYSEF